MATREQFPTRGALRRPQLRWADLLIGGAVFALFVPPEYRWVGFVFVAIGLAGALEWATSQFGQWWTKRRELEKLRQSIATLNAEEESALQTQVHKGERTFYMNPFTGGIRDFVQLGSVYRGLEDKGILKISATPDGKAQTLHVTDDAWKLLNRAFQPPRQMTPKLGRLVGRGFAEIKKRADRGET